MASKHPAPEAAEPEGKRVKLETGSHKPSDHKLVELNPADCNLDFNVEGNGLQGHALYEKGFAYCWSGARANVGITGGKYCFGCKIISAQPVEMEDTAPDQQHVCRVGISRGDDAVGSLGESEHSFGFGGTGKFSNAGKFLDYGTKFSVGDVIVCAVDLGNGPLAVVGFSKNGKWLGTARQFDAGPKGLGIVNSPLRKLPWESALFPHILLKNVVVEVQFSIEDGLVPEEGYKPWSSAIEDGNTVMGPTFSSPKDCEVMMMVGLPASGKTTWAENWVKDHPEKRYVLLGTNLALDQMKVPGLLRKQNYGERFDRLMDRATGIFNTLLARAAKTRRNYILDQTNVYKSARKRKMKAFVNYRKVAVVVFPSEDELKFRAQKRFKEMGKEVPADAVNEMLANYVLPMSKDMPGADEFFDQVMFPELNRAEAQIHLNEMKHALGSASNSSTKSDFSLYSRESSIQSFNSPNTTSKGAIPGGYRPNSHSPHPRSDHDFRQPQQVSAPYSGAMSYGRSELSPGGYRSGSSDPTLPLPRDSPHGNYSCYGRQSGSSDPTLPHPRDDPYGNHSSYGQNARPRDDSDPYGSYGGSDPFTRLNFESPRSSFKYASPGPYLGDPRLPRAGPHTPRGPSFDSHSPLSATYGSPYRTPSPSDPYGKFRPSEYRHSGGYPPPGPRY